MKPIYMDNNATNPRRPEVVAEMLPYFSDLYGNPSSMHAFGGNVGAKLKTAREQVASLLGAQPRRSCLPAAVPKATARPSMLPSGPIRRKNTSSRPGWSTRR